MPNQPTLVLLHGFAESRDIWTDFTQAFPADYTLLALDLPGHGANQHGYSDFSMEAQARYVTDELRQRGIEQAVLVGHSMGGYVALAVAEARPDLIAGLVLFHSTALPDTGEKRASRDKNAAFVRQHGVHKFMSTFIRPLFAPAHRDTLPEQRAFLEGIARATPEATILGGLEAMRNRPDRTHVLREARFPVLFIGGLEDVAVPPDTLLPQLALPAESHALLLHDVGHLGYLEKPAETRRAVLSFAARVAGA